MVWNIGGSQGQHGVGNYHTFPNKAVCLCASNKHQLMKMCITENKEVKFKFFVHSDMYNITETTEI